MGSAGVSDCAVFSGAVAGGCSVAGVVKWQVAGREREGGEMCTVKGGCNVTRPTHRMLTQTQVSFSNCLPYDVQYGNETGCTFRGRAFTHVPASSSEATSMCT